MKRLFLFGLLLLSSCGSPPNIAYCERLGVLPGDKEYDNCLNYFQIQDSAFNADYDACSIEADKTYPRTLYDTGRTAWAGGTYWAGRYIPGGSVYIEPDETHNAELDNLRQRIITPCMRSRGWKSGSDWEAGRTAPLGKMPHAIVAPTPLPWLKR